MIGITCEQAYSIQTLMAVMPLIITLSFNEIYTDKLQKTYPLFGFCVDIKLMHNFNKEDLQSVICLLSWMLVCFSVLYIATAVNLSHYSTPEFPNHRVMWYRAFRKAE